MRPQKLLGFTATPFRQDREPLQRGMIIHSIKESELPGRFPKQVAKLLIHVGKAESSTGAWYGMRETIDALNEAGLPEDLDMGLRELIAKHHL